MDHAGAIVDRAGAIVERYAYDGYGRPYIRESAGRGDMNNDTELDSVDHNRVMDARSGAIWDPRADLDDDGDSDADDADLFDLKQPSWNTREAGPLATVSQAFSDVDNRYAFQGVPSFVMDTAADATAGKLMLGHHRARLVDVMIGRWNTRDPLGSDVPHFGWNKGREWHHEKGRYSREFGIDRRLYVAFGTNPVNDLDPTGLLNCKNTSCDGVDCANACACDGKSEGDVCGVGKECIAVKVCGAVACCGCREPDP